MENRIIRFVREWNDRLGDLYFGITLSIAMVSILGFIMWFIGFMARVAFKIDLYISKDVIKYQVAVDILQGMTTIVSYLALVVLVYIIIIGLQTILECPNKEGFKCRLTENALSTLIIIGSLSMVFGVIFIVGWLIRHLFGVAKFIKPDNTEPSQLALITNDLAQGGLTVLVIMVGGLLLYVVFTQLNNPTNNF